MDHKNPNQSQLWCKNVTSLLVSTTVLSNATPKNKVRMWNLNGCSKGKIKFWQADLPVIRYRRMDRLLQGVMSEQRSVKKVNVSIHMIWSLSLFVLFPALHHCSQRTHGIFFYCCVHTIWAMAKRKKPSVKSTSRKCNGTLLWLVSGFFPSFLDIFLVQPCPMLTNNCTKRRKQMPWPIVLLMLSPTKAKKKNVQTSNSCYCARPCRLCICGVCVYECAILFSPCSLNFQWETFPDEGQD